MKPSFFVDVTRLSSKTHVNQSKEGITVKKAFLFLGLMLPALLACPDSTPTSPDASVPSVNIELDQYNAWCQNIDDLYCQSMVSCGSFSSVDRCKKVMVGLGGFSCNEAIRAELTQGTMSFNEQTASTCKNFLISLSTSCEGLTSNENNDANDACSQILLSQYTQGTVPLGGSCQFALQCVSGICTANNLNACGTSGQCVEPVAIGTAANSEEECGRNAYLYDGKCTRYVERGQSCAPIGTSNTPQKCAYSNCNLTTKVCGDDPAPALGEACAPGQACATGYCGIEGKCVAGGLLGDACDAQKVCRSDLKCSATTNGVCVASPLLGEACSPQEPCAPFGYQCHPVTQVCVAWNAKLNLAVGADCSGNYYPDPCQSEAYCDFATKKCVATLQAGADCSQGRCDEDLFCRLNTSTFASTCAARLAAGETCAAGFQCAEGLGCVGGKCRGPGNLGDACVVTTDCSADTYCKQSQCTARLGAGAACNNTTDCLSGVCDLTTKLCAAAVCLRTDNN